jgi:RHS repeat-associated protein
VTDATGNNTIETRYKAWGEVRFASGDVPTKYQYTGQYSYVSDFGLHFYNARWYDSALGRFAQADTIVPVPTNSQAWDRYAYAFNSPVRYTDPTGHFSDDQLKKWLGLKYIGMSLDEFKEKHSDLYGLLSAMHFGDTLYGTSEENGLEIFGTVSLDEHGVLSFGGSTLNDLIESGNTGWALSRHIEEGKDFVPYNSTGRPDEDFGSSKLYIIDEQDKTTGWGPYINYTAGMSLSGTLIGTGIGLLIPLPVVDDVVGAVAGFVIGTGTGLLSAPPGKMVGDNSLVTYYEDPTSNSVIYVETTIVRGNTVLQSSVQQISPTAP